MEYKSEGDWPSGRRWFSDTFQAASLQHIKRDQQAQSFTGIVQVNSGNFLDSFQAVGQGTAVDEQFCGGLEKIAFQP